MTKSLWKKCKLSQIMEIIGGGTPKTTVPEYWDGDIPWLSVVDFAGRGRWVYKTEKNITSKGLKESSTKILKKGQLIISARGTVGEIAQIGSDMAFNQSCYGLDGKPDIVLNNFLYYLLKFNIQKLKQNTHGAVFDTITRQTFECIDVDVPPIKEQTAIAKILLYLDSKIELNNQMNKTLESTALAIFKRWFVDFKFPGHEKTKFVNELPVGWSEGTLIDVCDIVMGQSPPGETYNELDNGVVFYQGNRDFGFRFPTPRVYCTAPTRIAEEGDVLISVRAPVGALNITLEQCAIGRGVAALRMKQYSNGFLFYFLSTRQDLWDRFNSEGTVFGCLNKTEFHKIVLFIPTDVIMRQFDMVVKPIEATIRNNELETRALGSIRDSLLPRMMSGQIRVK
ncbi:MAG: restriction endonuclease subunit S [Candidatus Omnitrophica bacterium]|nr:restriction endonuclease subunit S [Candidatus Omnitrophota bacterium]